MRSGAASYVTGPDGMERVSHRKLGNFRLQAVVNKDGGGGGVVPLITCWARCGSLAETKTTTERGNRVSAACVRTSVIVCTLCRESRCSVQNRAHITFRTGQRYATAQYEAVA